METWPPYGIFLRGGESLFRKGSFETLAFQLVAPKNLPRVFCPGPAVDTFVKGPLRFIIALRQRG